MTKISGIFAASMSVLNSDLSLNIEKTIDHSEKLIDQGCHGTVIFGSTGQAQLIPISEKIKLLNHFTKNMLVLKTLISCGFLLNLVLSLSNVKLRLHSNYALCRIYESGCKILHFLPSIRMWVVYDQSVLKK